MSRKPDNSAKNNNLSACKTIIDLIPEGIVVFDREGRITCCNKTFCRLTSYTCAGIAGKHYSALSGVSTSDLPRFLSMFKAVCEGKKKSFDITWVNKHGATLLSKVQASPVRENGTVTSILVVVRDLTRQKTAKKELEQEFKTIFNSAADGMIIAEPDTGKFILVNDTACRMLGYTRQELLSLSVRDIHPPEDLEYTLLQFDRQVRKEITLNPDARVTRKDGSVFYADINSRPIMIRGREHILGIFRDITFRKKKEQEIVELNNQLRHFFDLDLDLLCIASVEGYFLKLNRLWRKTLGYSLSEMEKHRILDLLHPDDVVKTRDALEKLGQGGHVVNFTNRYRCKDGTYKWLEWRAHPVGEGQIYAAARDITEQKKAELALQESEAKYRSIINTANEAIIVVQGYKIVFANAKTSEISGYSKKQLYEMNFTEVVHPGDRELVGGNYLKRIQGEPAPSSYEFRIVTRRGAVKWLKISVSSIAWHGTPATLSMLSDITARKSAQAKLADQEKLYREVFQQSPSAYQSLDANGCFLEVSQKWLELMGYSREEIIGLWFGKLLPDSELEKFKVSFPNLKQQGSIHNELSMLRKDGTLRLFSVDGKVEYNERGKFRRTHCVIRDITEERRAEEERRHLREKAEISSRLAALGEMAAGIAHEINNPLTAVVGFSQLLLDADIPTDLREEVRIIHNAGQRVKDIVQRMLTFARQSKPARAWTDIHEIIDSTLELRSYIQSTSNIMVIRDYDRTLPKINIDPSQIQQVILNIVVNAEDAMKEAHGRGRLSIKTSRQLDNMIIAVTDNGPGISQDVISRLFQPFITTKEVGRGTGLGLSLSRSIIQEHGGDIDVDSAPGKGATFRISLPLVPSGEEETGQAETSSPETGQPETPSRKLKIMMVDDEPAIRALAARVLGRSGHQVDAFASPVEALTRLNSQYDVILLDVRIPGMSGPEFYAAVSQKYPEMIHRIIFITGDASSPDVARLITEKQVPFIHKPVDFTELNRQINLITGQET